MKYIQRGAALLIVFLALHGLGIFAGESVSAARSGGLYCQTSGPEDVTLFPYGYMCGTAAGAAQQSAAWLNTNYPTANPNWALSPQLKGGDTVSFNGGFNPEVSGGPGSTNTPREKNGAASDEVMIWTYIDINDSMVEGPVNVTSYSGTADRCPGTGSSSYPPVRGHRDLQSNGAYGQNQSPFAYVSPEYVWGKVDCGAEGRMVYWRDAQPKRNHSFNIKLAKKASGIFCARQYISVKFDEDNGHVFTPRQNGIENDQGTLASHMVKASEQVCFNVNPVADPPPTPAGAPEAKCTSIQAPQYRYKGGVYVAASEGGYKVRYKITIKGITGGDFSKMVYTGSAPAGADNAPQTYNYTPATNGNVNVEFTDEEYFYDGDTETSGAKRKKDTWYAVGGDNIPNVSAGPCYNASCSIVDIDRNAPGGKVLPNQPVTFYATITNTAVGYGTEIRNGIVNGASAYSLRLENAGSSPAFNSSIPGGRNPANPNSIFVGETSHIVSFQVTAPASGTLSVEARTAYVGFFAFGTTCSASVDVYQGPTRPTLNSAVTCIGNVSGSSYHPDFPSMLLDVELYIDGTKQPGQQQTNNVTPFSFPVPVEYRNGVDHNFTVIVRDPFGYIDAGSVNTTTMLGCGKYTLTPTPNGAKYLPTNEDPETFQGGANITDEYPGWVNVNGPDGGVGVGPATAQYRYLRDDVTDAIGRYEIKPYTPLSGTRFVDKSYSSPGDIEPVAVAPGFQAGTEYCLSVRISTKSGYIDRTGVIQQDDGPLESLTPSCDKIVNEPTFVINNGSVITGGDYQSGGAGSCTGGGTLGGWFNNTLTQYRWGSGSQLAALGLTKTTGFASARTEGKRAPTDLSFANSPTSYVGGTSDPESPSLGGNYGGSYCLPTVEAETAAEEVTGNLSLGGEVLTTGQKKAYFRKGNVYIGGNITYNTTGWSYDKTTGKLDKVPSMVVKATGNIYISNNVTRLDGVYIAQRKDPSQPPSNTNGGIIYTCGVASYQPVTSANVYHNCRNQLTVYGTFIANKVNMMRSYGSLRDEKPIINKGVPPVNFEMTFVGNTAGKNCVKIYEPWAKFWTAPYDDNYLCVPTSANVALSWTYAKGNSSIPVTYGNANPAGVTPSNCVRVHSANWTNPSDVVPSATMAGTWSDNELCASVPITLTTTGSIAGASCTSIMEPGDPNVDASGARIWLGNVKICNDGSSTKKVISDKSVNLYRFACTGAFHKYSLSTTLAGCKNEGSLGGVLPTKSNGSDKSICTQESVGASCIAHGYGFSAGGANLQPVYRIYNSDSGEYLYTKNTGAALDIERAGYQATLAFYLYTGADFGGVETITTVPASVDPPATPLSCSNKGTTSTASTCAAEVYYYTPELYLAEPKIKRTTNAAGDGPIEIDSMTSLPPIL